MPFKTRRSSTRGTPRALFGNIGLMEPQIGGLNHDPPSTCNEATAAIGMSAFEAEPEIFCSIRALPVVTDGVEKLLVASSEW